ncbi:hypothetical protein ACJRO7_022720 [Eucalyptus globulus]|uniref:Uncharacterized protein n=1 Tax=Eucalyptus globulus TaxID=34317 RepID=A0ABD3JZR9_EUCGL
MLPKVTLIPIFKVSGESMYGLSLRHRSRKPLVPHPHRLKTEGPLRLRAFIKTKTKKGGGVSGQNEGEEDETERLQATWYAIGYYIRLYQSVPEQESYGHEG